MNREYRPAPMSLAQRAALRSQPPRPLRQPARRRVYPLLFLLALIVILILAIGGFEYQYRDRILPHVHVSAANLDLSGKTRAEAAQALGPLYLRRIFRMATMTVPGAKPMTARADQLGYLLDRNLTAWRAYTVGHYGSWWQRVKAQTQTLLGSTDVDVAQRVNQTILKSYIAHKLVPAVNRHPAPGVPGRTLDVVRTRRLLSYHLMHDTGSFTLALPVTTIPALPVAHPHKAPVSHKKKK